jgi:diketogulonate reductase-like aldo/keto reductase
MGTWKSVNGTGKSAVYEALKAGYRHIDCAWAYRNQKDVGEGILQAINEGIVKREDLWITSKLWYTSHAAADVEPELRDTLRQLQLEYLDLYLIHWPATNIAATTVTPPYSETWAAMEAVLHKGLVRTIGVCNMTITKLKEMHTYAQVLPAVCQGEMHPLLRQDELLQYCKGEGIHWTAYSPLGSSDSCEKYKHNGSCLLKYSTVLKVAEETGKTPGQVLIRWALQHGTSVIPKSANVERIRENFEVWDWALSAEQFAALSALEPQTRMLRAEFLLQPGGPYKTVAEFWDEE